MVYFSKLFGVSHQIGKAMMPLVNRKSTSLLFNSALKQQSSTGNSQLMLQQLRGSHGRVMPIRPGKFYTKKYFDIIVN